MIIDKWTRKFDIFTREIPIRGETLDFLIFNSYSLRLIILILFLVE